MADSFFGFNTTVPVDDDGGGGLEDDDYDALNDETFAGAINGDWESLHDTLVELDQNGNTNGADNDDVHDADIADLDFNLARVGLEDCEEVAEDNESRVQLDPSVWAHPIKPNDSSQSPFNNAFRPPNADAFMQQQGIPHAYHAHLAQLQQQQHHHLQQLQQQQRQQQQRQQQQMQQEQHHFLEKLQQSNAMPNAAPKILSVEDIERNMRNQQVQHVDPTIKPPTPQHQQQMQQQAQQFQQQMQRQSVPPGLVPPKGPLGPHQMQLPPGMQKQPQPQQQQRLPPGFPPMNMMQNMAGPLPPSQQMHPNMGRPMPPNVPLPMGNFPMHPNFNPMRSGTPQLPPQGMQQQQQQQQMLQQQQRNNQPPQFPGTSPHNMQQTVNQFNKRLVQEIQQNHPMLRMNNNPHNNQMGPHHQNQLQQNHPHGNRGMQNQHHQQNRLGNGHLDQEYDPYANLMSNRDKQWLIGIQLQQLNTGTPYIDDFYYTVYKERKARMRGEKENKAHKDNQLNHPLTQPKGHAQLVLISMGNKNGGNQQRNNQNGRERKNSESNKDKDTPRTYTPLQFENSLGKLQCGSVTAPRKIIDMDIVGADSSSPSTSTNEISAQRKSRQILMHIETLYRIALKLEDFENPTAIATALIVRERKEKERQLALEQERIEALIAQNKENQQNANVHKPELEATSIRSSVSLNEKPEETKDELLAKLLAGLTLEKVSQMINIRKGKTLLKRVLPLIQEHISRWDVWCAIFSALPIAVKKDKDDAEGHLFALFTNFQGQIKNAPIDAILRITNTLIATEKMSFIFLNKFSISCVVVLLLKVESVYAISSNAISSKQEAAWLKFLSALVNSVNKNANVQLTTTTFEKDILKPLVCHFSRFRDLKSQPLLAVLTQRTSTN